jgi:ATP-dependent helicase/nuclease subunit A
MNLTASDALDPGRSAVVEACAGSGKTWMLVSRIIRLLLAGVPPGEILAITFTRMAAREMELRLVEWLKFLALSADGEVIHFLKERGLSSEEAEDALPRARGLFEEYLIASPTVAISTFDVWYLRLLRHAPLASSVSRDSVAATDTERLRQEAWQSLLRRHRDPAASVVGASLEWLFTQEGLSNTRRWVMGFSSHRAEWWAFTAGQSDPVAYATSRLREELGVEEGDEDMEAWLRANPDFGPALERFATLLDQGSASLREVGAKIRAAWAGSDLLAALTAVFWTQSGGPRQNLLKSAEKAGAAATEDYRRLIEQLEHARHRQQEFQSLCLNRHIFLVGQGYLDEILPLKLSRREADFLDIQWSVYSLLSNSEQAEYLQYRLDARYRHLLLDEFQDTNPLQWLILKTWLQASLEAERAPTVFMVGDPKQSIYRFRRADARLFDEAARYLQAEWRAIKVSLDVSRRSGTHIIGLVNRVFRNAPAFDRFVEHATLPDATADAVELIEIAANEAPEECAPVPKGLRNPLRLPRTIPQETLAEREARAFARLIADWVGSREIHDAQTGMRPMRYGDILVLVRSRLILPPYERALRAAQIPYLSRQRGGLLGALEIRDVRQLLAFLLNPESNFALAQTLRSPIFGAGDEELLTLSESARWWPSLQANPGSARLAEAARILQEWMSWATRLPVHDLLDRIVGEGSLIQRYQQSVPAALQASVKANLQAFLELALNLDSGRYPSLAHFLQELDDLEAAPEDESPDEGRLGGEAGDAVRIMTIHGAKGLEAPVVWLLEPRGLRASSEPARWFVDWPSGASQPEHFSLVPSRKQRGPARDLRLQQERLLEQRENLNLLYVALTRAQQLLVISGRPGDDASPWFGIVREQALPEQMRQNAS